MAFESQQELPNTLESNSLEEETASLDINSESALSNSKPNSSKKSKQKSPLLNPLRKALPLPLASDSTITTTHESNGRRSMTDLPSALLSEILRCLDAKDFGVISCVSTLLHSISTDHRSWKDFYCERWGLPPALDPPSGGKFWKDLFVEKQLRSKSFMGRFTVDCLRGHTDAVRSVFLLQSAKLVITGGYDSTVRLWDMEDGLSIAESRPLGCTVRAITADTQLLVAGGTDAFLQCWRAVDGHPHIFDIAGSSANHSSEFRLWGHEGPVTCLALDSARIYSGSWDMSVRIWDRAELKCVKTLRHGDWVFALSAPRGSTVATTAGGDAYVWDIESGELRTVFRAHSANASALARTHPGDLLFTGADDGSIHMFDIFDEHNKEDPKPAATWIPHSAAVRSLAFDFPWLISASTDGRISLIDVGKLLSSRRRIASTGRRRYVVKRSGKDSVEPPQRMLHGYGCNLLSVGIGADRIVCGGEDGVVRMWNFSQALEIERRVQALRNARLENRMRRRKAQIAMIADGGNADRCSVAAAKRNQLNGGQSGIWHAKRGVGGKLKA